MLHLKKIEGTQGTRGNVVSVGDSLFYLSYDTIVAFSTPKTGLVCCENCWSRTTNKHLNKIAPKEDRIDRKSFLEKLEEVERELSKSGF